MFNDRYICTVSPSKMAYLMEVWHETFDHEIGNSKQLFDIVKCLYSDQRRKYHNLNHIWYCLREVDYNYNSDISHSHGIKPFDITLVRRAIWFHDLCYTASHEIDEIMSQELMMSMTFFKNISVVSQMISLTASHLSNDNTLPLEYCVFLDADMSILASEPEEYKKYSRSVIEEYKAFHFQDINSELNKTLELLLMKKRFDFLNTLYNKESIFLSVYYKPKNAIAKENILNEIKYLEEDITRISKHHLKCT